MPYGLNQFGQFSDYYKNKLSSVDNKSAMGYSPIGYSPSSFSTYKSSAFNTGFKTWSSEDMLQTIEENKGRSTIDRLFDSLSVFNYTMMGGVKAEIDSDPTTNLISGVWEGLKASNPFGNGYQKGEVSASDVLTELGWKPNGAVGGIAKFGTGLALDILTDPTTYMTFGVSGLLKGTGTVGKYASKVDDFAKTVDATSDVFKNFRKLDGTIGDTAEQADKIFKRKATPDDIKEWLGNNEKLLENITEDDYVDLAKRVNKYAGLTYDEKNSALAFDFFSNKSWGFRKEFVSSEKMAELGDKLGTAPFTQSVIDEIVMHPWYSKLGKSAERHVLARTNMDELAKTIRAEDLSKGNFSMSLKAMALVRDRVRKHTDKMNEEQLRAVTKNMEDHNEFLKYKRYDSVADMEEGKTIINNILKEKEQLTNSIDKVTDLYGIYKTTLEVNNKTISRIEKLKNTAFMKAYGAKNQIELIEKLKTKYSDVHGFLDELDNVVKQAEKDLQEKDVVKTASKLKDIAEDNIEKKVVEFENEQSGFSDFVEFINKAQLTMSDTKVAKQLKRLKDDYDMLDLASAMDTQAESLVTHVNDIKPKFESIDEFTKVDLETGEFVTKTKSELDMQYVKSIKNTNSIRFLGSDGKNIVEQRFQAPYGWETDNYAKAMPTDKRTKAYKDLTENNMKLFSRKFGKDKIEFTIKQFKEAQSIMHLVHGDNIEEVVKDFKSSISSVRESEIPAQLLSFLKINNPPMYEYYKSLNLIKDINKKSILDKFEEMMFNTPPIKLNDEMIKFTQNYPAVNPILTFREIKLIPKLTEDSIEDVIKQAIKMYGDNTEYYKKTVKSELISYVNRQYYNTIEKIVSSDDYMNEWLTKLRSETDMDKLKETKFSSAKSKKQILEEVKDDVFINDFYSNEDNVKQVVDAILHAPNGVVSEIGNKDMSKLKKSYDVVREQINKRKGMLDIAKKNLKQAESNLKSLTFENNSKLSQYASDLFRNVTDELERKSLYQTAKNNLELESKQYVDQIKQYKSDILLHSDNISKLENQIVLIRSELLEDVTARKFAFEESYKMYKYQEYVKNKGKLVPQKPKPFKVKLSDEDVNGINPRTITIDGIEGEVQKFKSAGNDGYFDYRNTTEWAKQLEQLDPKETTESYTERINEFFSSAIESIKNAHKNAMDDLDLKKDEISLFESIKKSLGHDDDSIAYDMYSKLENMNIDEQINVGKLKLTESDFATQLVKRFFEGRKLKDLGFNEVNRIEIYIAKAQEDGLLTKEVDRLKADRISGVMKYIQKSKEVYQQLGGNVEDINKLDLNLADYETHLRQIDNGAFIWDDLKSLSDKTENALEYEIKHLNVEDVKLSKLEDREMAKITLPMEEFIMRRANQLLERMTEDTQLKRDLFILQKRLDNVVNSIGNREVAMERIEDMLEMEHQINLAKVDSLSSITGIDKQYLKSELYDYDNISQILNDANLKVLENKAKRYSSQIATNDDKIKTLKDGIFKAKGEFSKELNNARRISGIEVKHDVFNASGIDEYITALEQRIEQLDGFIVSVNEAKSFKDFYSNGIGKYFGNDLFRSQFRIDEVQRYVDEKMSEIVTDTTKFKLDTTFNQYQQELSVMLYNEFNEMKDMENLNVFIKNYIPHMINPKYQYFFVKNLSSNPLANYLGLSLEKFNKHSLSRRWNLTIEQYKGIVRLVNSDGHIYDSEYYKALQEASTKAMFDSVKNGDIKVKTPYGEIRVRYDSVNNKFIPLFDDVQSPRNVNEFSNVNYTFRIDPNNGEYIKDYGRTSKESLYSNFLNQNIDMDMETFKIFEEIKPMLDVVKFLDGKSDNYMHSQYHKDVLESMNPKIMNTIVEAGVDFFKKMPEDLFEEDPLKLYLNRALLHNKLLVDEEVFPQIKSLLCRKPERDYDGKLLPTSDKNEYVVMTRDMDNFIKDNYTKDIKDPSKVSDAILDQQVIYDKDKIRNNTFITLTHEQALYMDNFASFSDIIHITNKHNLATFNEVAQKQLNAGMEAFLHWYDTIIRLWKLNVTVVSPAFHITNKIGNVFNSFMDVGFDTLNPQLRKSAKDIIQNRDGFFKTKNGKEYKYVDLLSYALDLKVIDDGMFGKELRDLISKSESLNNSQIVDYIAKVTKIPKEKIVDWQKFNPLNAETALHYKKGTEIGAIMENMDRMVNWLAHVNNGDSFSEAMEKTNKFLFDYSKGTPFEKEVLKRVFPFWSFLRNNTKLQYQMLLEKPQIYRTIAKVRNEFEAQTPYEERIDKSKLEAYARDWWMLPVDRETKSGDVDLLLNPNLPFQGLNVNVETVLGMINPIMKAPYELATGKSIYSNKPIYSSKLEYLATQTYYGSTISKLDASGVDGKILKLASALLGIKIGQYNEEKENLLYKDSLIDNRLDYKQQLENK